MTSPTISVVMAAYKGAALVGETIESLFAQTLTDWELVVVDDCSPDNTLDVLRRYDDPRIRVIASRVNQGPVKTRNMAMAEARGRFFAGLDQDDICLPDRFARQLAYLDAHPDVVLVGATADLLEDGKVRPGLSTEPTTPDLISWRLHFSNPLVWSSVMMRADVARQLDPITRPDILYAEDFDLYHRISALGRVARIDEPLLLYRIHAQGASKTFEDIMIGNSCRVLAEAYAPIMGDAAEPAARAVILHVMKGDPVPDRVTLDQIGAVLMQVRSYLAETRHFDFATLAEVDRSISAIWWRLIRTAVRSGALPPTIVTHPRPEVAQVSDLGVADMMVSGVIGAVRRIAS
jgi:GT2 family glycosyltransferase